MRSFLFVPGNRPERFDKAMGAGADAVILDLEDAVAEADKVAARVNIATARLEGCAAFVRINAFGTPWFGEDLKTLRRPQLAGILLPKAESPEQVAAAAAALAPGRVILPIIESALGLWRILDIACAAAVERLVFGSLDFQADLGCDGSDAALLHARSQIVLASRVAGLLPPVDGVTAALDDSGQLQHDVATAKALGFGAKLCIHPKQVAAVNAAFSPSGEEIAWARQVIEAAERAGTGAVAVAGAMVDLPVLRKARRILELAPAPDAPTSPDTGS